MISDDQQTNYSTCTTNVIVERIWWLHCPTDSVLLAAFTFGKCTPCIAVRCDCGVGGDIRRGLAWFGWLVYAVLWVCVADGKLPPCMRAKFFYCAIDSEGLAGHLLTDDWASVPSKLWHLGWGLHYHRCCIHSQEMSCRMGPAASVGHTLDI